jgi:uncharacterized protein (DUF427 family)
MIRATWNGKVLAESNRTQVVEGNHYFPADDVKKEVLRPSDTHTTCGWKGEASYYSVEVDGKKNEDAAWYYPTPKDAAKNITGYVAFWKGVDVKADGG